MNTSLSIQKLFDKSQMIITHSYKQNLNTVWNAFTQTQWIEKWWAPLPYQAIVVENNFVNDGIMHYYMLSPQGDKHYCLAQFSNIIPLQCYSVFDAFCDENKVVNTLFPRQQWYNSFKEEQGITTVTNVIQFNSEEDMNKLNEMGFEQGYTITLNQLFNLLHQQ